MALLAFTAYRLRLSWRVDEQIAQFREAGHPVTLKELDKWYSLPADKPNGAPIFLNAFDRVADLPTQREKLVPVIGSANWPPAGKPLPADMEKAIARYLKKNAQAVELFRQGSKSGSYRYPIDLTKGPDTLLPHLSKIKEGVQLLRLHASYKAAIGEPGEAVRSIEAAWRLANSVKKEPILISQLVRIASQAITYECLERVLNQVTLTRPQLKRLSQDLKDHSVQTGLKRSLIGERCFGLAIFESPPGQTPLFKSKQHKWLQRVRIGFRRFTGAHSRDKLFYLETITKTINAFDVPFPKRLKEAESIPERMGGNKGGNEPPGWLGRLLRNFGIPPKKWQANLSDLLLPSLGNQFGRQARILAKSRLAKTALAIEQFRSDQGHLPKRLDRLVPDYQTSIPNDPFVGKPIHYRIESNGYRLYSVGPNRQDDQGKSTSSDEPPDIVFAVDKAH